ncbi:3-keto-5-aminohexanoate cleavage protein [uncultured Desulfosarcina sp.]|uniref:3-keto-5-aminohexanoate cleavage protein n=1 Tax=uncultured Desulfosarcina sp. TaxID=218289 RepID=UPI0029C8290B|nr:3-keto-5-aminohexanoate cleavage protein [uncultured Desulfosarcina sp.]
MGNQVSQKAIITAAVSGAIHTPTMSPHLPITPQQLIDDIMSVYEAGGAVAHLHVRDPETGQPKADQEIFREVAAEVKKRCDIVLCMTTGGSLGDTVENRAKVVTTLEPELASLNAGSLNFALFHVVPKYEGQWKYDWERQYLAGTEDFIFPNTFYTIRKFTELMGQYGTKPEFEIYDVGMINNLAYLIDTGKIETPVYLQFVLGILGGIPATAENLVFLVQTARQQIGDFQWSVCAAGRTQLAMTTHALLMGGHARVGLEDNLYLEKGVLAKSSGEQVAKLKRIAEELGVETATPAEARQILGLKGLDKVNF